MKRFLLSAFLLSSACEFTSAKEVQGIEVTPDVVYGHKMGMALTLDVLQPKANANGRGVLFMVSGGWVSPWNDPVSVVERSLGKDDVFGKLLRRGYTVFLVRHGGSPAFKANEAVDDVRRATRHVRHHAAKFGVDPGKLGVCGGSAGGHLALMLGTTADGGKADKDDPVDKTSDQVAAVVAYFPPTDLESFMGDPRFPALHFDAALAKSVSPVHHASVDDPPTLLIHGAKDDLVKLEHSEKMLAALKAANVKSELIVMPEAGHGFKDADDAKAADALVAWFDKHLFKPMVVVGTWDAKGKLPDGGERASELILEGADGKFTGRAISKADGRETKLDVVKLDGDKFILEINIERDGQKGVLRVVATEKEPGKLVGKWGAYGEDGTEHISNEWEAVRRPELALAGKWSLEAEAEGGEKHRSTATFAGEPGSYTGVIQTGDKERKVTRIAVKGKELEFDSTVEIDGQELQLRVVAKEVEPGALKGEWKILAENGTPAVTGPVTLESDTPATKIPATPELLVGDWEASSKLSDENVKTYTLSVTREGEQLSAVLKSPRSGEHKAKSVAIENGEVVIKWFREVRSTETDVVLRAVLTGEKKMRGKVSAPAIENYKGDWKAEKKAG